MELALTSGVAFIDSGDRFEGGGSRSLIVAGGQTNQTSPSSTHWLRMASGQDVDQYLKALASVIKESAISEEQLKQVCDIVFKAFARLVQLGQFLPHIHPLETLAALGENPHLTADNLSYLIKQTGSYFFQNTLLQTGYFKGYPKPSYTDSVARTLSVIARHPRTRSDHISQIIDLLHRGYLAGASHDNSGEWWDALASLEKHPSFASRNIEEMIRVTLEIGNQWVSEKQAINFAMREKKHWRPSIESLEKIFTRLLSHSKLSSETQENFRERIQKMPGLKNSQIEEPNFLAREANNPRIQKSSIYLWIEEERRLRDEPQEASSQRWFQRIPILGRFWK